MDVWKHESMQYRGHAKDGHTHQPCYLGVTRMQAGAHVAVLVKPVWQGLPHQRPLQWLGSKRVVAKVTMCCEHVVLRGGKEAGSKYMRGCECVSFTCIST